MSCSEFYSVQALATPDNVKSIYWRMSPSLSTKDMDLGFYVDVADESMGPWTTLNPATPVVDGCVYIDDAKYRYGMVSDVWYRVRAVLTDPLGVKPDIEYESAPAQLQGALTDRAYLVAKNILRAFYKQLMKGGGQQGFFMKRKIWGDPCPNCVDFDVDTVVNAHCGICYGTGIVGGFHEGMEFWVMPKPVQGRQRSISAIGTTDDYTLSAECAAYPWVDAEDMWVDAKTNERFLVKSVSHVVELERKPVILNLNMVKISNTDEFMEVPVADETETFDNENTVTDEVEAVKDKFPVTDEEAIKSDKAAADKGWRRGLKGDDF